MGSEWEGAVMSTWWDIKVGDYVFFENSSDHFFEWYFHKSDRKIITIDGSERYVYETTSETMLKRLALDGIDRRALEKEFDEAKIIMLDELELAREFSPKAADYASAFLEMNLDDWLQSLRKIIEEKLVIKFHDDGTQFDDPAMDWMLTWQQWHSELAWDFPCISMDCYAVAVLLAITKDTYVRLDCTDLIGRKNFTAFQDYIEYCQEETNLFSVFKTSLAEIILLASTSNEHPTLAKFLYAGIITAMETYLSDTLKRKVNHYGVRRRYVKHVFDDQKIPLRDIFDHMDEIDKKVRVSIDKTSFHNIQEVSKLYDSVLMVKFPPEHLHSLKRAVDDRHDIVHRNGRSLNGDSRLYTFKDVHRLSAIMLTTLKDIDMQIQDTLISDE